MFCCVQCIGHTHHIYPQIFHILCSLWILFLNWVFYCWVVSVLYIFWVQVSCNICKYFLSFCGLYSQFLGGIICSTKLLLFFFFFTFDVVPFFLLSSFVTCDLDVISKNLLSNPKSWRFTSIFGLGVLFSLWHVSIWSALS